MEIYFFFSVAILKLSVEKCVLKYNFYALWLCIAHKYKFYEQSFTILK